MKKILLKILVLIIFFSCGNENSKENPKLEYFDYLETTNPNDTMRFLKKDMSPLTGLVGYKYFEFYGKELKSDNYNFYRSGQYSIHNTIQDHPIRRNIDVGRYINGKKDGINFTYNWNEWNKLYSLLNNNEILKLSEIQKLGVDVVNDYETKYGNTTGLWFNPKIIKKGNYNNGLKNGLFSYYNKEGNLTKEITWKNGKQDGIQKYYYEDGENLNYVVSYKDLLKSGEYKYYYKDGQIKVMGQFDNNNISGIWKSYYKSGKLEFEGEYENGQVVNKTCYDDMGNIIDCNLNWLRNNVDLRFDNKIYLNKIYYVRDDPKSLTDFSFQIPPGFEERSGERKETTIKIFEKSVLNKDNNQNIDSTKVFFSVLVFKWSDFPKYKKFLSMSESEITNTFLENLKNRDGSIDPNEFFEVYKSYERDWVIMGTSDKKKNLSMIGTNYYSNQQNIGFMFMSTFKDDFNKDIKMVKELIDSFIQEPNKK